MYKTTFLLLLSLLFVACNEKQKNKKPVANHAVKESPKEVPKEILQEKTKAIPKPPVSINKTKEKALSPIEKELATRREAIRNIVRASLSEAKPGLDIHQLDEWHPKRLEQINALSCTEKFPASLPKFDIALRKAYQHSSENTHLLDGQAFCWYEHPDLNQVKIIYSRNEGGHTSDELSLVSVEKVTQTIYRLPLVSWFGREGYACTIESEWLAEQKVRRKIVERLAWKTEEDLDGSLQPRSETVQIFQVHSDGGISLEQEEVVNFNFDEWLEEGE